ncbi:hypothetical protein [Streptomyces spirodelae]|uniref:Fibronectin type-III domain-containing protein n=1 Tax=Streptomyces spirodelae TaxID=2812904 RepID=A0ABS3WTI1_9ACTN|nr:hypothetical protein [Streptomyces spirodelae]MBO8186407.1 hypothetical protein [Streptomyces spirodelae]
MPGATCFTVAVLKGGRVLAQERSVFGVCGSVTLPAPLVAGTVHQVVAAVDDGTPGAWGTPLTLVIGRLQSLAADYDGALAVSVRWKLPETDLVNGARVTVAEDTGDPIAQELLFGTSGTLALPKALDSSRTYTLRASAAFGTSTGPAMSESLVTVAPTLKAVVYDRDGSRLRAVLDTPVPGDCLPGTILYGDGEPVAQQVGTSGFVVQIALDAALDPSKHWVVRPFWLQDTVRGPLGPAVEVPVVGPTVTDIRWHGDKLALRWENQPGPPYPTGAQIDVRAAGEIVRGVSGPGATSCQFTPTPPLLASSAYTVTVASLRGVAQGAASTGMPVIATGTALGSADYDGRFLTVAWNATAPPHSSVATLLVTQCDATVAEAPGGDGALTVEVPLNPAVAYSAALRWSAFPLPSRGPAGPAAPLISAAPAVSTVEVAVDKIRATIAPPPQAAGIARYAALLEHEGVVVARSAPVEAGETPIVEIPYEEGIVTTGLVVRAQGLGPAEGVQVSGPLGPSSPVIATAPAIRSATLDGTSLTVSWALPDVPVEARTRTTLVVTPSTGEPAVFPNLPGTSAQVTVPSALISPTTALTLSVTATGPTGSSPAARTALISTLPSVTTATWDGRRLSAAWAWAEGAVGSAVATAYRLSIVRAGELLGSTVVAGLSGTLTPTTPIDPAACTTLQVDAIAGVSECLASTGPTLLTDAPVLQSTAVTDADIALTWTGPTAPRGAVTGLQAVFTSPGRPPQTAVVSTEQPRVPIPQVTSDPLVPVSVGLRATGNCTEGPVGNRLTVLRQAPTITAVQTCATGSVEVSWSPVLGACEYLATLYRNGTPAATAAVAGTTALLSTEQCDPGARCTVAVTARAGGAAGRESARATVILTAPVLSVPEFDGRSLQVTATAPGGAPLPDSYALTLLRDGIEAARATVPAPADGRTLTLPFGGPVENAAAYTLTARAITGQATGPVASVGVVLATPEVTAVECDSNLAVRVSADALRASNVALTAGLWVNGVRAATRPVATDGVATFDVPAAGTVTVAARVSIDGATGPWSGQVRTPTTRPTISAARYDGDRLEVVWTPPGMSVVTVKGTGPGIEAEVRGSTAVLPFSAASEGSYAVAVTQRAGIAVGPPATLPLVTAAPTLALTADETGRVVTAAFTTPTGTDGLVPLLITSGAATALPEVDAASSPTRIVLPEGTPRGSSIALRARVVAALGPPGLPAPVVHSTPRARLDFTADVLSAAWELQGDPRIDGALVTLAVQGQECRRFRVSGNAWSTRLDPVPLGATVAVAAAAGAGTGPPTSPLPALLAPPVITSVTFDSPALNVVWTAPASGPRPTGYLVTVSDTRNVLMERVCTDTDTDMVMPSVPDENAWVTVRPTLGDVTGPVSEPVPVPLASPSVTSIAVDPLTGAAEVAFTPVTRPPAEGYEVQLFRGGAPLGAPVHTPAATAVLPADTIADPWDLSVAVRAHATVSSVVLIGPYGLATELLTALPERLTCDYNGVSALLTWKAPSFGAHSGYRASVIERSRQETAANADLDASARAVRLPITLSDDTGDWQIALQVRRGYSTGPPVRQPLFSPGIYLRSDGQPRVCRASTPAVNPAPTTAYLPEIGPLNGLPIPPSKGGDKPALHITANDDRVSSTAFPYVLTIGGEALGFPGSEPIRSGVWRAYTELLASAEQRGATPWGIVQLQQVLSRLMPQTFAETLLYAYGLSPTGSSADLRPGMVLRVGSAEFDLMPSGRTPAYASGYANGAGLDYEVADYLDGASQPGDAAWLLGFDSFLSWLTANGVITVSPPECADGQQSGAAEAADIYHPTFRQPFYRLFFPAQVQPTTPPADTRPQRHFTIAAAASYSAITNSEPVPGPGVAVAYFRGRSVLKLAIRVTIDGAQHVVPVGTTVGNILDRFGCRPPRAATELLGLTLERALGPSVLDPGGYNVAGHERVRLDYGGLKTFDQRDALSLPLLHGDRLSLGRQP